MRKIRTLIQETIGTLEFWAIILGVPSMIAFIANIWGALSSDQKIVAGVFGGLILLAIGLFIYGRVRKYLYVIPQLLYKMRCRAEILAQGLKIEPLEHLKTLALLNIPLPEYMKQLIVDPSDSSDKLQGLDIDKALQSIEYKDISKWVFEELPKQMESEIKLDKNYFDRITAFYGESSGLENILSKDKEYSKLHQRLERIRPNIPTKEISLAVNNYIRSFKAFINMLPAYNISDTSIIPLKQTLDLKVFPQKIDDFLSTQLAEVRECIDKYYRGSNKS